MGNFAIWTLFLFWAILCVAGVMLLLRERRNLRELWEFLGDPRFHEVNKGAPGGAYNVDSICTKCHRICPYCYPETKSLPDTPVERSQPSAWSP